MRACMQLSTGTPALTACSHAKLAIAATLAS